MMIRKQVHLINRQMINVLKKCGLTLVCCVWAAVITPDQSINGRISSTITDQTGAVISNADPNSGALRDATRWFNKAAFALPARGLEFGLQEGENFKPGWFSVARIG